MDKFFLAVAALVMSVILIALSAALVVSSLRGLAAETPTPAFEDRVIEAIRDNPDLVREALADDTTP